MYNEQIEQLVSAALADGILTEKEKQILFKKAQSMGIDLDEFEMVLDARLVELKKAEKEKAEKSAPKSSKYGDVRKCPVCGALVPTLAVSCTECGYEFSGVDENLSSKKLADAIDKIQQDAALRKDALVKDGKLRDTPLEGEHKWDVPLERAKRDIDSDAERRISQTIKGFSIPIAKADLFEFSVSLQSKVNGRFGNDYLCKLEECILKIKTVFPNDPMFKGIVEEREKKQKAISKKRGLKIVFAVLAWVAYVIGVYSLWHFLDWHWFWKCVVTFFGLFLPMNISDEARWYNKKA